MADTSSIEWTESTWNPTTGCDKTSPGCDNCYALALAKRLKAMGQTKYQLDGDPRTSGPGFGISEHPDALDIPRRWKRPRTVFVNSMSDLFHPGVSDAFISDVFSTMAACPQHTFQVLTKRSKRLLELEASLEWPSNVWIGVSVESDRYCFRARHLAQMRSPAVRFLSCEPLLGRLDSLELEGIDWVIAGGESGPRYRPVELDWVRQVRDLAAQTATPFFFKQWGGIRPKSGGRELDGEVYDEMPAVAS